jgi:DNA-binding NarL/FixJ family response regulator
MLKRSTPARLLEAIKELNEGGSPMSSSIARKVVASFQQSGQVRDEKTNLSPREQMVLEAMAKGLTYKQAADQFGISIGTIRTYVRRIYEKLHVQSRTEAVAEYLRH